MLVRKLVQIQVIDLNDNLVYVDNDSENIEIYRNDLEFYEVRLN